MQKCRTHFQDQMVITSHKFEAAARSDPKGKGKRSGKKEEQTVGLTNLVLIVNNWQFVRDVQNDAKCRGCTTADFQVQLKLSSTAFRNSANPDCQFPYDKHAANFPYDSFVYLMTSPVVRNYVREVKKMYLEIEGPLDDNEDEEESNDDNDDDDVTVVRTNKRRKAVRLNDEEGGEEEEGFEEAATSVHVVRGGVGKRSKK